MYLEGDYITHEGNHRTCIESPVLMLSPENMFRYKRYRQLAPSAVISSKPSRSNIYTGADWTGGDQLEEAIEGQLALVHGCVRHRLGLLCVLVKHVMKNQSASSILLSCFFL